MLNFSFLLPASSSSRFPLFVGGRLVVVILADRAVVIFLLPSSPHGSQERRFSLSLSLCPSLSFLYLLSFFL